MKRSSTIRLGCGVLVAAAMIGLASAADDRSAKPSKPATRESSGGFFRLGEWIPAPIDRALRDYESGRFFSALANLDELSAEKKHAYALDDAQFLRALCLAGLGWEDLAATGFTALLEAKSPGPYYVPALLELVEIHDRAARWEATAGAWEKYVDKPGKGRARAVASLLEEFGELRPGEAKSTRKERSLFSRPKELAVLREDRRERSAERLLYRSGLALLRVGKHEPSLRALYRIGVLSPYYPYARYSIAQNLFALGRPDEALDVIAALERYPMITPEEKMLTGRARVLHMAILSQQKDVDRAIGVARSLGDDDPEAAPARLMIATALLEKGEPALSLVYGTPSVQPVVSVEARQALLKGAAYRSLGDESAAVKELRAGIARLRASRAEGAALDKAVGEIRELATSDVTARRAREDAVRAHVAKGMRIALAYDGPWNLGTMLRRIRATLGAGPYREFALGIKQASAKTATDKGPWPLAYVASPRQGTIESVIDRLDGLASKRADAEAALRILDGFLAYVERAPITEPSRVAAASAGADLVEELGSRAGLELPKLRLEGGPVAIEVAAYRRRLSQSLVTLAKSSGDVGALEAERARVSRLLDRWIDHEIRELVKEREAELHEIELDLDVMLGESLAATATPPR